MSVTLTLTGETSVLETVHFPPVDLSDGEYECGLIDLETYHSIPNVTEQNNKFLYGTTLVKVPVGTYDIEDIEKYVHKLLGIHDKDDKAGKKAFSLQPNMNTLKSELHADHDVDFDVDDSIGPLLGFEKKRLRKGHWHEGDLPVKITDVNEILVECNIVEKAYNQGQEGHIIHQFTPSVDPGYKVSVVPQTVIYLPVSVREVSTLRIRFVDQDGELVDFRGEKITVRLHIRRRNAGH